MYSNGNNQVNFFYQSGGGDHFARCIEEITRNIQAPKALVAYTALAVISTSLQGVIDVESPDGRVSPTSLYILIRGKSGERKSSVFNRIFSPIVFFQNREMEIYRSEFEEYKIKNALWCKKRDAVLKKITGYTVKGRDTSDLERDYIKIESEKPSIPKRISILYDDATQEALVYGMSKYGKYAALASSEGESILRSGAFRAYAKPNELWSGGTVKVDRKSSDCSFIENGRLSICIMVQPEIHDLYLDREDDQFRNSGLWARFLVSEPISTIGTRQVNIGISNWENSDRFAKRILVFLDEMKDIILNGKCRHVVKMSHEAKVIFLNFLTILKLSASQSIYFQDSKITHQNFQKIL